MLINMMGASSKDELLGKNMFEFLHPDYHDIAKKRIGKAIESLEMTDPIEYQVYTLDGTLIDIELISIPFKYQNEYAVQVLIKDISGRKRAYKAVKASGEKFKAIFDTAPDPIILLNTDGTMISWNASAEDLFGYSCEEIIGRSLSLLISDKEKKNHSKKWLSTDNNERVESCVRDRAGNKIPVEISVGHWNIGKEKFFTAILRNVSERKKFEDQLRYLATTDNLTGILNRRTGLMLIEQAMKTAKRDNKQITVCYLDIDNFKLVNDKYGHVEGDKVLRHVSAIIERNLRESDVFCRLGGDEFIISWYNMGLPEAARLWKRIEKKFEEWKKDNYDKTLGISTGFVCPDLSKKIDLDKIIEEADKNMYENKNKK
jgi:diguanylate cyclase (GGDEF)-like protein/PAS domain S-box-containing protein